MRILLPAASCALFLAACSPGGDFDDGPLQSDSEAIINGLLDTTHQAVVAYLQGGKCSATIIQVSGNQGYALTAAHCISGDPGVLRQGDTHANGNFDVQYTVVERFVHPEYADSGLYDFAVLRFAGATASTPTIAPLTSALDNLTPGKQLNLVGYGQTQTGGTSFRHSILRNINFQTALRLNFNQMTGGMCSGDSGGGALYTLANTEYVAGVHAFVSGDCTTSGTSLRVSAVNETFIQPVINGTPILPQNCAQCNDAHIFNGACTDDVIVCLNDNDCSAYISCLQGCTTQSCAITCAAEHASGKALYDQIYGCLCNGPCATECIDDGQCQPPPACGLTSGNDACQTCFEASCCAEANACAGDAECVQCVTNIVPPLGCDENAQLGAFNGCLASNCPDECNMGGGSGGAGGGPPGAGGATVAGVGGSGVVGVGGGAPSDDGGSFEVDEGCSCRIAGVERRPYGGWLALLVGLAGAAGRRQRRRRRRGEGSC